VAKVRRFGQPSARLALGSGDQIGEALKVCFNASKNKLRFVVKKFVAFYIEPRLSRHPDDVFSIHSFPLARMISLSLKAFASAHI
jgi:hypothetical protein